MISYPNYRDLERCHGVSWHELVEREPRLAELLWQARQACARCRRWADVDRVFTPIKLTLAKLIGFAGRNRWHPILGCVGAYEVAYWKLYDAVAGLLPVRSAAADEMAEMRQADTTAESQFTSSDPSRDSVAFAGSKPF
jgi:hypothetical protein